MSEPDPKPKPLVVHIPDGEFLTFPIAVSQPSAKQKAAAFENFFE